MNADDNNKELVKSFKLTESQQQEFLIKTWALLKWQAGEYNGLDSTSMPIEKAQDLLDSSVYTLSVAAREDNISAEDLLQKDFKSVIDRGRAILESKRKAERFRWKYLCLRAPDIDNVYYVETIKNLGLFFKKYECRYEAHHIPVSIDYPLMISVSEEIKGISYVEEYVSRISRENQFINKFDRETVIRLFERSVPGYREYFFNMCELVLTNAIGRKLLGQDIKPLEISEEGISALAGIFKDKRKEEILSLLCSASHQICDELNLGEKSDTYFSEALNSLAIRVEAATASEHLSNVFVIFSSEGTSRVLPTFD